MSLKPSSTSVVHANTALVKRVIPPNSTPHIFDEGVSVCLSHPAAIVVDKVKSSNMISGFTYTFFISMLLSQPNKAGAKFLNIPVRKLSERRVIVTTFCASTVTITASEGIPFTS